jgi:hypothetical protein
VKGVKGGGALQGYYYSYTRINLLPFVFARALL